MDCFVKYCRNWSFDQVKGHLTLRGKRKLLSDCLSQYKVFILRHVSSLLSQVLLFYYIFMVSCIINLCISCVVLHYIELQLDITF